MKTTKKKTTNSDKAPTKKTATRKSVSNSNTAKKNNETENFPGYPHYDPKEDITKNQQRVDTNLDDETLTDDRKLIKETLTASENRADNTTGAGVFDVNEEDLEALGPKDLSLDGNDDEQLKQRSQPVDFAGDDLDVPGSELDDAQEAKGSEDEENNVYSLGGDKS
jgi:hypothetical protein